MSERNMYRNINHPSLRNPPIVEEVIDPISGLPTTITRTKRGRPANPNCPICEHEGQVPPNLREKPGWPCRPHRLANQSKIQLKYRTKSKLQVLLEDLLHLWHRGMVEEGRLQVVPEINRLLQAYDYLVVPEKFQVPYDYMNASPDKWEAQMAAYEKTGFKRKYTQSRTHTVPVLPDTEENDH